MPKLPIKPLLALAIAHAGLAPQTASACEGTPYLGEVCAFAFNFCPHGFLAADGSLLPINQYEALFALLGTYYGGNGTTNFGLPDLRGRSSAGMGQGQGLTDIVLAETGGAETVSLGSVQMPAHTHPATTTVTVHPRLNAVANPGNSQNPAGKAPAISTARDQLYSSAAPASPMAAGTVTATANANTSLAAAGGGQPLATRSPFLGQTYCIAISGIFPTRN